MSRVAFVFGWQWYTCALDSLWSFRTSRSKQHNKHTSYRFFLVFFSLACVVCREEAKKQNPQKAPNLGPCQVFSSQIGASMIPSKKRIKHTKPLRYVSSMMGSPLTCVTFFGLFFLSLEAERNHMTFAYKAPGKIDIVSLWFVVFEVFLKRILFMISYSWETFHCMWVCYCTLL